VKREKIIISVSSDIAGLFGRPEELVEVYSDCRKIVNFGLEVICWRRINRQYFERVRKLGMQINGLHGPVNTIEESFHGPWLHQLKGKAIDSLMIRNYRLRELSLVNPAAYVLVHQSLVNLPKDFEEMIKIASGFDKKAVLLVENLTRSGSIYKTIEDVQELIERGVGAGVMIDLVHLVKDIAGSHQNISVVTINKYWQKVLSEIERVATKINVVGFHIPIGLNGYDSLPVDEMEKKRWTEFAEITAKYTSVKFKTIENQRSERRMLFPISKQEMKMLQERNYRIMSDLEQAGVI